MEGMQIPLQSWWKLSGNTRCGWIPNAFLKSGFVQYSGKARVEMLIESMNNCDRSKLWTINAELGQACSYDQQV